LKKYQTTGLGRFSSASFGQFRPRIKFWGKLSAEPIFNFFWAERNLVTDEAKKEPVT
jgi:hypothetical protein